MTEQLALTEYSITFKVRVNRQETRAVIDDTLARIRAIPNITVVNSNTDESASDLTHAVAYVEFKFLPEQNLPKHIKRQVFNIKKDMKRKPYVESVIILWNTLAQV
jgi:carbon monoxide dehydrogenase subunit G